MDNEKRIMHFKPYYAVIFSSQRTDVDEGYDNMAKQMDVLAKKQPGYLGIESYRESNGRGVTISYWQTEEDIKAWKAVMQHQGAQKLGKEKWYANYTVRVAKVEREYGNG